MIRFTYAHTGMCSARILMHVFIHVTNRRSLFIASNWTAYSWSPKYYVHSLKIHPFSFTGICSATYSPHVAVSSLLDLGPHHLLPPSSPPPRLHGHVLKVPAHCKVSVLSFQDSLCCLSAENSKAVASANQVATPEPNLPCMYIYETSHTIHWCL